MTSCWPARGSAGRSSTGRWVQATRARPPRVAPRSSSRPRTAVHPGIVRLRQLLKRFDHAGLIPGRDYYYWEVAGGEHNEAAWAARFDKVLLYFFGRVDGDEEGERLPEEYKALLLRMLRHEGERAGNKSFLGFMATCLDLAEGLFPDGDMKLLKAEWKDGRWTLMVQRPLKGDYDEDTYFEMGKYIPTVFFAWDGHNGDVGRKLAVSAFYYTILEPPIPRETYIYPTLIAVGIVILEGWVLTRRANKRKGRS